MLIQSNISLKPYTTFQVDAKAKFFCEVKNEEEIQSLITNEIWTQYPHLILGGGANILFTKDYEGLVVKTSLLGKEILEEKDGFVYIKVWSGEDWHETMMQMLEQGFVGWENLVYIPGQVGSAPVGNIWAYGKEAKDIIFAVEWIDLITWEKTILSNTDCHFAYRDSIFKRELKDRFLITSVIFQLQRNSETYIPDTQYKDIQQAIASKWLEHISGLELAHIIIEIRKNKLPDRHLVWTAWSFFKNPVIDKAQYDTLLQKYPNLIWREVQDQKLLHSTLNITHSTLIKLSAWQLIELAWLKWYRAWDAGVSPQHALVLLNYGNASGEDIVHLAEYIQKKVEELFALHLEPEVIYV